MERHPIRVQFAQKAVVLRDGKILLVRKSKDDLFWPGMWEMPGGRMGHHESPDEALVREIREEVGLTVIPGRPLALWSWRQGTAQLGQTTVAVARLCEVADGEVDLTRQDAGDFIDGYGWFERNEIFDQDLIPADRGPLAEALEALD